MKTKRLFLFLGLSIFLSACGNDNSSSASTEQDDTITTSSALPESSNESPTSSSSAAESSNDGDESSSSKFLDLSVTGFIWVGYALEYQINTGIAEAEWYMFNDSAEGGHSTITWPVPLGTEYYSEAFDPVIDECEGICGTFNLNQGSMDHKPYVGVGFNLAGRAASEVDASAAAGICITYTSDVSAALLLGLSDEKEDAIGYDNPFTTLPKSETASEVCTTWERFKQAGWGTGKITGDEAAAALVAVKFKIQAADSTTGEFSITGIRSIPCCAVP
ncbi:hypothetical protein [uncultured Fibrobacter sp.]|uniref:hypothetical protein n=1 Tax=uncultured Fibrobacter sp. TaxID=261512 RepID=UPI0025E495D4|nr:hypothetical protein [uncultured Fibrobacter sp.]